jgi:hypothetical protein
MEGEWMWHGGIVQKKGCRRDQGVQRWERTEQSYAGKGGLQGSEACIQGVVQRKETC